MGLPCSWSIARSSTAGPADSASPCSQIDGIHCQLFSEKRNNHTFSFSSCTADNKQASDCLRSQLPNFDESRAISILASKDLVLKEAAQNKNQWRTNLGITCSVRETEERIVLSTSWPESLPLRSARPCTECWLSSRRLKSPCRLAWVR